MHLLILFLLFVFKATLILLTCVRLVPQGYHWTVERFGGYCRTLKPGVNLIIPGIEAIARKVSIVEQTMKIKREKVISADNAMVTANAVCVYRVTNAALAGHEVDDVARSMRDMVRGHISEVLSSLELLAMTGNRLLLNGLILAKIEGAAKDWGVVVDRFEIYKLAH